MLVVVQIALMRLRAPVGDNDMFEFFHTALVCRSVLAVAKVFRCKSPPARSRGAPPAGTASPDTR